MQPSINTPELWKPHFPWPQAQGNKYDRGHAVIAGGPWTSTGAARLAAHAALRIGAGLVSIACDARSLPIYAASLQAVMTKLVETPDAISRLLDDARIKAVLVGPGAGVSQETRDWVFCALAAPAAVVLDADALTVFADRPAELFASIREPCILTPHAGEFVRLFSETGDALTAAQAAARHSGAIIVLKGARSVIAAPDGRTALNTHATPFLATAGTGDVLAGMCTGLLAQGMEAFDAACAATWLHGEAACRFGAGLIAEDIADQLPRILKELA